MLLLVIVIVHVLVVSVVVVVAVVVPQPTLPSLYETLNGRAPGFIEGIAPRREGYQGRPVTTS